MQLVQTLTLASLVLATGLAAGTTNAQTGNIIAYFLAGGHYDVRPQAGNYRELVNRHGTDTVWHGEFAGKRRDIDANQTRFHSYFASGCFLTERACRIWQIQSLNALRGGLSIATRCHRPVPDWDLR